VVIPLKILIISDTHNSEAYIQRAAEVASKDTSIRVLLHLGDVGSKTLASIRSVFRGLEIYIIAGNHDRRKELEDSCIPILEDGIIPAAGVTFVTKSLPRIPVAGKKYENRLVNLIIMAQVLCKPVILLSHCGGKIACNRWWLQAIEGGHARATARMKPDLEIHGHKHPSRLKMYFDDTYEWWPMPNEPIEGDNVYNAAFNVLVLDTKKLQVEVKTWT